MPETDLLLVVAFPSGVIVAILATIISLAGWAVRASVELQKLASGV